MRKPKVQIVVMFFIIGVFVSTCKDDTDAYGVQRDECVDRINDFRASINMEPLDRWTAGENCADEQARKDSESGVAHGSFGDCGESAQNECPGWGSLYQVIDGCIQMMWDEGPGEPYIEHGHYLNMTNNSYSMVACGYHETSDGSVWSVMNFK